MNTSSKIFLFGAAFFAAFLLVYAAPASGQAGVSANANDAGVLYSSSLWKKGKEDITGLYTISQDEAGDRTLRLSDDFMTKSGPDLKVVLSPHTIENVNAKTALDGALVLGSLVSIKGASEYAIPKTADLSKYQSVLIHCEKYTKLWGGAALVQGQVLSRNDIWTKKNGKTSGHYEIARDGDEIVIRFGHDFKTKKAPDLQVALNPLPAGAVNNDNALNNAVVFGVLSSHKGAQEWRSSAIKDLDGYQSLVINCEEYTKLWAVAEV